MKFDLEKFQISRQFEKSAYLNGFLKLFFILGGISKNHKLEIIISTGITTAAVFELLGCIIGFMNTNGIDILFSESVAYALFLTYHWIIKRHKKRVVRFAFLVRHPNPKYVTKEMNDYMVNQLVKIAPYVLLFNIVFLFSLSFPMLLPLFTEVSFQDNLAYIMPYWYFCDQHGSNNFPVRFLCFHVNDFNKYWLINITAYVSVVIGVFIFESTTLFYLFTQIYLRVHHRCILQRIRTIEELSNWYHVKIDGMSAAKDGMANDTLHNWKLKYDKIIDDEFANVIRYYQFIFNITQNVVPIYRSIISSTLIGIYTIGVFCIFYFMSMTQKDAGQLIFQMKMGLVLVNVLVVFLFFCFGADYIKNMNDEICAAAYETPWHRNSVQYRKMLLIFLAQTQKPIRVTAFGMYRITLNYYMLMVKNIYSILNVVLIKLGTE